jgi:hypothetical protein
MLSIGNASTSTLANAGQAGESVLLTTPLQTVPKDAVLALIVAGFSVSPGTGVSAISIIIRRGTTVGGAGIIVAQPLPVTPGVNAAFSCIGVDTIINFASVQYALTATVTGGSVASACSAISIGVLFLQ